MQLGSQRSPGRLHGSVAVAIACTALLAAVAVRAAETPAATVSTGDLVPNPSFENDANADGRPDEWRCQPAAAEADTAMRLDSQTAHTGQRSLRFRHGADTSYSKLSRGSLAVRRDADYTASCWVKVADDDPVRAGIEEAGRAKLLIVSGTGPTQRTLSSTRSMSSTDGEWHRATATFNTGGSDHVIILFYLHKATGTVWVDDVELVEGTTPTPATSPRVHPFPRVDFMPGTVAMHDTFHMLSGAPTHVVFYYLGDKGAARGLELVLDLPAGVSLTRDFASPGLRHTGTPVTDAAVEYTRYVLPVPPACVRDSFVTKHGHILILEANGPPRQAAPIRWRLRRGDGQTDLRSIAVNVLPPLPPLRTVPETFEILTFYSMPLRFCPNDADGDVLFDRILDITARSGLRGGVLPATTRPRVARVIARSGWSNGTLAGWMGDPARYMTAASLREAQAVDARGKAYPGTRPCPTYCEQHHVMASVAEWSFRKRYGDRASVDSIADGDWFVLDYEPGKQTWRQCCCRRCLDAFAEHTGSARERVDPSTIATTRAAEWQAFRDAQKARIIGQFQRAVQRLNPTLRFGLCDGPRAEWSRELLDPVTDFRCPMLYDVHPRRFFDVVARERVRVRKPFLPTIETKMGGYTTWTSPRELGLKIMAAAASGTNGIMIWPGTISLSALDLAEIRRCNDLLVTLAPYFTSPPQSASGITVRPAQAGFAHHALRVHRQRGRQLLTLFNFHSQQAVDLDVAIQDAPAGNIVLADPVSAAVYLTPAGGRRTWSSADMRAGFRIRLPASQIAFVALEPQADDDLRARTVRLQAPPSPPPADEPYVLSIRPVPEPPAIDGDLGDPAWNDAAQARNFVRTEGLAEVQTVVRAAYDRQNLYIAFACAEPQLGQLVAGHVKRDSAVWSDDCAEVFIRAEAGVYSHFIVNPANALYDACGRLGAGTAEDVSWNGLARCATGRTAAAWTVEMAIPFSALAATPPAPGDAWGVNVCRTRMAAQRGTKYDKHTQSSSWIPVFGNFLPPSFGELRFVDSSRTAR